MKCRYCGAELERNLINHASAIEYSCSCDKFKKDTGLVKAKRTFEAAITQITRDLIALRETGVFAESMRDIEKDYKINIENYSLEKDQQLIDYGF